MYTLARYYKDGYSASEQADDISTIFSAASIYLEDKECIGITIWYSTDNIIICDFWRDRN